MLKQYSIVSKCLSELKSSDLPVIEKLKIEVQLIQTKRILLDYNVEQRVSGVARSEKEFSDLYEQIHFVCNSKGGHGGLDRIKTYIHEIKDGLNYEVKGGYLSPLQLADNPKSQGTERKPPPSVKDIFKASDFFPERGHR